MKGTGITPKWFERGDRGDGVKELPATLNRDFPAYSKLDEDGVFGPSTEAVVREFSTAPV